MSVVPVEATPAPTTEQVPAVEAAPPPDQLSPKFAALARQQKAIRREQQELKAQKDALKAKEEDYRNNYISKERFKKDPYAVLTEEGVPYDSIVNAAMSQDPQSLRIKELEARLDKLNETQVKNVADAKADQQKKYDQAVNNIRNEVKILVDAGTEYEAIKANDAQEAVVELIKENFEKTGKILTVEDASKQVEEYLLEEAIKLASLSKVKQRLNPVAPVAVSEKTQGKQATPQIKTLTNARTIVPSKVLTPSERRERAIAAFRGELT